MKKNIIYVLLGILLLLVASTGFLLVTAANMKKSEKPVTNYSISKNYCTYPTNPWVDSSTVMPAVAQHGIEGIEKAELLGVKKEFGKMQAIVKYSITGEPHLILLELDKDKEGNLTVVKEVAVDTAVNEYISSLKK